MNYTFLESYKNEVFRCIKCGACRAVCPTFTALLDESMGTRGRMSLVEAVIDGRLGLTEGFKKRVTSCIDCKACVISCPSGVRVDEIIYAAKAQIATSSGLGILERLVSRYIMEPGWPLPYALRFLGLFEKYLYRPIRSDSALSSFIPFMRDGKKRRFPSVARAPLTAEYPEVLIADRPRGRVAFYAGCVINYISQGMGRAAIKALHRMGMEVIIPKDQVCCGIPVLSLGDVEVARSLAKKNIKLFNSLNVDAIVTACPTCTLTLKKDYNRMFPDNADVDRFSSKVFDIHEYMERYGGPPYPLKRIEETVTYHDPCHLNRGLGISKSPRDLIRSIKGLQYVEMAGADRCCGFGGFFSLYHYDLSMRIAEEKVKKIADTGANVVATACPGCQIHLQDALHQAGLLIRVTTTVELLDEAWAEKN